MGAGLSVAAPVSRIRRLNAHTVGNIRRMSNGAGRILPSEDVQRLPRDGNGVASGPAGLPNTTTKKTHYTKSYTWRYVNGVRVKRSGFVVVLRAKTDTTVAIVRHRSLFCFLNYIIL